VQLRSESVTAVYQFCEHMSLIIATVAFEVIITLNGG